MRERCGSAAKWNQLVAPHFRKCLIQLTSYFSHKLPSSCKAHLDNFRQKGIFPESWRGRAGEERGCLYLETSFKRGDPVVAQPRGEMLSAAARRRGWMETRAWEQFLPQVGFAPHTCFSGKKKKMWGKEPHETWRFGPAALGQRGTRHCSKATQW